MKLTRIAIIALIIGAAMLACSKTAFAGHTPIVGGNPPPSTGTINS